MKCDNCKLSKLCEELEKMGEGKRDGNCGGRYTPKNPANNSGDYVSRRWLLDEYDKRHRGPPGEARKLIEEAPSVAARPVVFARWIDMEDHLMCSGCGATHNEPDKNFCPNCGADMTGGAENGENLH